MSEIDSFELFRTTLFVALSVYTVATMALTSWHVARLLQGADPRRRLLRTYLGYVLVSFRVTPLRSELIQIALWTTMLLILWWLHTLVP
jgi:hypothetical protein